MRTARVYPPRTRSSRVVSRPDPYWDPGYTVRMGIRWPQIMSFDQPAFRAEEDVKRDGGSLTRRRNRVHVTPTNR